MLGEVSWWPSPNLSSSMYVPSDPCAKKHERQGVGPQPMILYAQLSDCKEVELVKNSKYNN